MQLAASYWGFVLFAFVSSITPGPNNIMLLSSGARFGFSGTISHLLGVAFGYGFMVWMIGLGVAVIFKTYPLLSTLLYWFGLIYMLYLAWHILRYRPASEASGDQVLPDQDARPLTFWQAALFQWVNPKAWMMAVGAFSLYFPQVAGWWMALLIAVAFTAVMLPCVASWAMMGSKIRIYLSTEHRLRIFNWVMALVLVVSIFQVLPW